MDYAILTQKYNPARALIGQKPGQSVKLRKNVFFFCLRV